MDKLYFILLLIAALLLLADAFFGTARDNVRTRVNVRLLPLALFFWVLVPLIQVGKSL